ncbi:MAG TPA: hypothetical protein VK772_01160 [Puia sp.]|jgi:hypothetical protein|nr:hypothetical protein [Puia sp.]
MDNIFINILLRLKESINSICLFTVICLFPNCKNFPCAPNSILTVFVGFQESDIDHFVIRRYKANDNYRHLVDTFIITNPSVNGGYANGRYAISNDTTIVFVDDNYPDNGIFPGYDWTIYLPALNKSVSVSNIISPQITGDERCVNPIYSFIQDSTLITGLQYFDSDQYFTNGYRIYITP